MRKSSKLPVKIKNNFPVERTLRHKVLRVKPNIIKGKTKTFLRVVLDRKHMLILHEKHTLVKKRIIGNWIIFSTIEKTKHNLIMKNGEKMLLVI